MNAAQPAASIAPRRAKNASSLSAVAEPGLRRQMLRREGFAGSITLLSNDSAAPVDRPNLSKDYLAGSAPEEWLPLRDDDYYKDAGIDLRLKANVTAIDPQARQRDAGEWRQAAVRQAAARDWRRARSSCRSPARTSRMSTPCARSPTAVPSSRRRRARSAWS